AEGISRRAVGRACLRAEYQLDLVGQKLRRVPAMTAERRILVLAPTSRDAALTESVLRRGGMECFVCGHAEELARELQVGAGAILVAEEVISAGQMGPIAEAIAAQRPWSDIPVMLVTSQGADSNAVAAALQSLGNVTLVERPTRVTALMTTA